jgi:hypothetical protein
VSEDSSEERQRKLLLAELQCEAFISVMCRRYGISEDELPELISGLRWAAEHKVRMDKLSFTATVALLGTVVGATLLVLWEGFKRVVKGDGP